MTFVACNRLLASLLASSLLLAATARAQPAVRDSFEGPETAWTDAGGDAPYLFDLHRRVNRGAHGGDWCEQFRIRAGNGTHVYVAYDVGQAPIIDELACSLWLRSEGAGLQALVRVVLPRSEDPATGQPRTLLLRGDAYSQAGQWQQLFVRDLPRLLAKQARVARSELGADIDTAEAYVDRLLLNVYGGEGTTLVWIDDLAIEGFAGRRPGEGATGFAPATAARREVRLAGDVLLVDGRPFLLRAVEHRGEPLEFLRSLGFNAVRWSDVPPPDVLADARRLDMWVICPPPLGPEAALGDPRSLPGSIGTEYDCVLAWDLGDGLAARDLERTRAWATAVRQADHRLTRPILCGPAADLRGYSRHADILHLWRAPLGTSLEFADHAVWLRERPRLALPGKPVWTTIQTGLDPAIVEQAEWITGARPAAAMPGESIRLLVCAALSAGVRGLCFATPARLDEPRSAELAQTLELVNLELDLAEPWLAAGGVARLVSGSDPQVQAALLKTERARLLLPMWSGRYAQFAPGQAAARDVTFVVLAPETYKAYDLSPGGMQPLRSARKPGGAQLTLDEFGLTAQVLLAPAQERLAVASVTEKLQRQARRRAELRRALAAARIESVRELDRQLATVSPAIDTAADWLAAAQAGLGRCDAELAARRYDRAALEAERALRPLRMLERAHWDAALEGVSYPATSPLMAQPALLPDQWRLAADLRQARRGPNLLAAGDLEDLRRMADAGWLHFNHPLAGVQTAAELSPVDPHAGEASLRIKAWSPAGEEGPAIVESPPVWITSPAVPVESGRLLRIHGYVRVPQAILGSVDGLMVFDSLTGEALAERIGATGGWREFTLYRAAPHSGDLRVTFALTGLGEAWLDDVTVEVIDRPPPQAAALPERAGTGTSPF